MGKVLTHLNSGKTCGEEEETTNPAIPRNLASGPKFSPEFETRVLSPYIDPISQAVDAVSTDTSKVLLDTYDPTELDDLEIDCSNGLSNVIKGHLSKFHEFYKTVFPEGYNPNKLSAAMSQELMANFMHIVALSKSSLEEDIYKLQREVKEADDAIASFQEKIDSSSSRRKMDQYGSMLRDAETDKMRLEKQLSVVRANFDSSSNWQHELSFDVIFPGVFKEILPIHIQAYGYVERLDKLRASNTRLGEYATQKEYGVGVPVVSEKLYRDFSASEFQYDFAKFFSRFSPAIHSNDIPNENIEYERSIDEFSQDKFYILFDHISAKNLALYNRVASSISEAGGDHREFTDGLADLVIHYLVRIYRENVLTLDNSSNFPNLANKQLTISAILSLRIGLVNNFLDMVLRDYEVKSESAILQNKNDFLNEKINSYDKFDGETGLPTLYNYSRTFDTEISTALEDPESDSRVSVLSIKLPTLSKEQLTSFAVQLGELKFRLYKYSDNELRFILDTGDPIEVSAIAKRIFELIKYALPKITGSSLEIKMAASSVDTAEFLEFIAGLDVDIRSEVKIDFINSLTESKLKFAMSTQEKELNSTFYFDAQIHDFDKDDVKDGPSDSEIVEALYAKTFTVKDIPETKRTLHKPVDLKEFHVHRDAKGVLSSTVFNSPAVGPLEITRVINNYIHGVSSHSNKMPSIPRGIYKVAKHKSKPETGVASEVTKPLEVAIRDRKITREMPAVLRQSLMARLARL